MESREEELRRTQSETLKLELDTLRSNGLEVQKGGQQEGAKLHYPDKSRLKELKFIFPYLTFPFASTSSPSSSPYFSGESKVVLHS